MDSSSLVARARAKALEKRKSRAPDPATDTIGDGESIQASSSTSGGVSQPQSTAEVTPSHVDKDNGSDVVDISNDSGSELGSGSTVAREQAASLLERARARVATATQLTPTGRSDVHVSVRPPDTKDTSTDEHHRVPESLKGVVKVRASTKVTPRSGFSQSFSKKTSIDVPKTKSSLVAHTSPLPHTPIEGSQLRHANMLRGSYASVLKTPDLLIEDKSALQLYKESFRLSNAESTHISTIIQDLEGALRGPEISAAATSTLNNALDLLRVPSNSGSTKLPLAVGASGGCQLIVKVISRLCQQNDSRSSTQNIDLSLSFVLHLLRVGDIFIRENFDILMSSRFLDNFDVLFKQYGSSNRNICVSLLGILEVVVHAEPVTFTQNPSLLEVVIELIRRNFSSNNNDQESDVCLFSMGFRILVKFGTVVESHARLLLDYGLLQTVLDALKTFKDSTQSHPTEALAACACEILCCVLQYESLLEILSLTTELFESIVTVYLAFHNNYSNVSGRLVKYSSFSIALMIHHFPRMGSVTLQRTASTHHFMGEIWKNLFQYKLDIDAIMPVLILGVMLSDVELAEPTSDSECTVPECVIGCLVDMMHEHSKDIEKRIVIFFLLFNVLRIENKFATILFKKFDFSIELASLLEELLTIECLVKKDVKEYFICAVNYICCCDQSNALSLREAGVPFILDTWLLKISQSDEEHEYLVLRAFCSLYDSDCVNTQNDKCRPEFRSLTLPHLLTQAMGVKATNIQSVRDVFSTKFINECHLGTLASEILKNFSWFENYAELFNESICLQLFDIVKKNFKLYPGMCAHLFTLFFNLHHWACSGVLFLEGNSMKTIFDLLSGHSLDPLLCETACCLLAAVIQSSRSKERQIDLEYNKFFMQNIVRHHTSDVISSASFQSVVRVFNALSFTGSDMSPSEQVEVQTFLLGGMRTFQHDSGIIRTVLTAVKLLEVVFSGPSIEVCREICEVSSILLNNYMGTEVCSCITDFLYLLSTFDGGYCLVKCFADGGGAVPLLHFLRADGRNPNLSSLQSALQWLNTVCREFSDVISLVSDLNGCMVMLSLLDLACIAEDGALAVEVTFAIKLLLQTLSTSQNAFRQLNALQFLIQGLITEWNLYDIVISENLFWCVYLICKSNGGGGESESLRWDVICEKNESLVFSHISMNVTKKLKQIMRSPSGAAAGCAAVGSLCSNPNVKLAFGEQGCCATVVALMEVFQSDAILIRHATWAIACMTTKPGFNIDLVRSESFYNQLMALMHVHDSSSEIICANILAVILNCDDDYKLDIFRTKIAPKIFNCMKYYSDSQSLFSIACDCIFALSEENADNMKNVHSGDVVQVIVRGLEVFGDDVKTCTSACNALGAMAVEKSDLLPQVVEVQNILIKVVQKHNNNIVVGKSACDAICRVAAVAEAKISDLQLYRNVTLMLNKSKFQSTEYQTFCKTLRFLNQTLCSIEDGVGAIDELASLRQTFVSKDNNSYLSALLSLQSFADKSLKCRLALERNEALEILAEAVSVWRDQPFLVGTTLKAVNSICCLESSIYSTYNICVVHMLTLNFPELVFTILKEMWETPEIVTQGTTLLYTCLSMNPTRFSTEKLMDVCATLNAIFSKHVHIHEVVANVCSLFVIISQREVEYFTREVSLVPIVDALRVHFAKAAESSSRISSLTICNTIAKLACLREPRIISALGKTDFFILVLPTLGNKNIFVGDELSQCIFSVFRSILDPNVGSASKAMGRDIVQLGGCKIFVDELNQQRLSSEGVKIAAILFDMIFYIGSCDEKASLILNRLDAIAIILKTTRVFLNDSTLCGKACRCLRLLASTSQDSTNLDCTEISRLVSDVLRIHHNDSETALASVMALASLVEIDAEVINIFDPLLFNIFGTILVDGLFSPDLVVQCCNLLTTLWPKLSKNGQLLKQQSNIIHVTLSASNLYSNKPVIFGSVIDFWSTAINNGGCLTEDSIAVESLCLRLEEFCESELLMEKLELACEVSSLVADMCHSPLCLEKLADSSICELLTVAYDNLPDAPLYMSNCVSVWEKLCPLQTSLFCDIHISYRLASFVEDNLHNEVVVIKALNAVLALLKTSEGKEEFLGDESVCESLVASILSPLLTSCSTLVGVEVLTALLETHAQSSMFLQNLKLDLICQYIVNALDCYSNQKFSASLGIRLCGVVMLASTLIRTCPLASGFFDYSKISQTLMINLPIVAADDLSAVYDSLSSYLSHDSDIGNAFLTTGGKALVDLLANCSMVAFKNNTKTLASMWKFIGSLIACDPRKGSRVVSGSGILENSILIIKYVMAHCDDQCSDDALKFACEVISLLLRDHANTTSSPVKTSMVTAELQALMNNDTCSTVMRAAMCYLARGIVSTPCFDLITAMCVSFPEQVVPLLLGGGMWSVLLAALEYNASSQQTVVSLNKCIRSLIIQSEKDRISPFFLSERFRSINSALFQAHHTDAVTLLEICRTMTAISSAAIHIPMDSVLLADCICNCLDEYINESFLVLELLIVMDSSLLDPTHSSSVYSTRELWRSFKNGGLLTTLLKITGKYCHIDTVMSHALSIIKEISVYDSAKATDVSIFTEDAYKSLLALLNKCHEGKIKAHTVTPEIVLSLIARIVNNVSSVFKESVSVYGNSGGFEVFEHELKFYSNARNRDIVLEVLSTLTVCAEQMSAVFVDKKVIEVVLASFETDGLILSLALRLQSFCQGTVDYTAPIDGERSFDPKTSNNFAFQPDSVPPDGIERKKAKQPSLVAEASELLALLTPNVTDGKIITGLCLGLCEYARKDSNVAALVNDKNVAAILVKAMRLHVDDEKTMDAVLDTVALLISSTESNLGTFHEERILSLIIRRENVDIENKAIRDSVLNVVALLSSQADYHMELIESNMHDYSLNLLLSHCKSLSALQCSSACLILYYHHFYEKSMDGIDAIASPQLVSALMILLEKYCHEDSRSSMALLALLSLLSSSPCGLKSLVLHGVVEKLMSTLSVYIELPMVAEYGLKLLRNLVAAHDNRQLKVLKTKESCSILGKIMSHMPRYTFTKGSDKVGIFLENVFVSAVFAIEGMPELSNLFYDHTTLIENILILHIEDGNDMVAAGVKLLVDIYGCLLLRKGSAELPDDCALDKALCLVFDRFRYIPDGFAVCDNVMRLVTMIIRKVSKFQSLFGRRDFCQGLIAFMSTVSTPHKSLLLACDTIVSLAEDHIENITVFNCGGAVQVLAKVIEMHDNSSESDVSIMGLALQAMVKLINNNSDNSLLYGTKHFCDLVSGIFEKNLTVAVVVKPVVEFIGVLAHLHSENANNILETIIPNSLSQTLVIHASNQDLIRSTLHALWLLCRSASPSANPQIRKLHMSQTIQSVISRHVEGGLGPSREGLGALMYTSLIEFNEVPPLSMHSFFISAISKSNDIELACNGLESIVRVCRDKNSCSHMLTLGVCEKVRSLFLLHQNSAEVVATCCHAIGSICHNEDGVIGLLKVGVIDILCSALSIFSSDSAPVCVAVLHCFSELLEHGYEEIATDLLDREVCNVALKLVEEPVSHSSQDSASVTDTTLIGGVFKFIRQLILIVPSSAMQFGQIGAVELVLYAVLAQSTASRSSPTVCLESIVLLKCLCFEPQNVTKIVLAGGFQSIISLIKKVHIESEKDFSRSNKVVCALAELIACICSDSSAHCTQYQNTWGSCGAVPFLVDLIGRYTRYAVTVSELLSALNKLCNENELNVKAVMSASMATLLPDIFTLLSGSIVDSNSSAVLSGLEAACDIVIVLASSSPANADALGMTGLCDNVVEVLQLSIPGLVIPLLNSATSLMKDNIGNQTAFGRNRSFYIQLKQVLKNLDTNVRSHETSELELEYKVSVLSSVAWTMTLLGRSSSDIASINSDNSKALFKHDLHMMVICAVQKHSSFACVAEAGCYVLAHTMSGLRGEDISALGEAGGCDVVVNSFLNHQSDLQVIEAAVSALASLTLSPENVNVFKSYRIVNIVSDLHIFSLSSEISSLAPAALMNLSLDSDISEMFGKEHICSDIQDMFLKVQYQSDGRDMVLPLTICVYNLLVSCPHNSMHFSLVLPKFIELFKVSIALTPCDTELVIALCSALSSLIKADGFSIEEIKSASLCECLSDAFKQWTSLPTVALALADVIIVLCLKHELSLCFVEFEVLSVSNSLIYEVGESHSPLYSTLQRLLQVLSCESSVRVDIGLRGECSTISSLLRTHISSESTTMKNCESLKKLIHKNSEYIDVLLDFDLCETILGIMRTHSKNTSVLVECILITLYMVNNSSNFAARLDTSGGIEAIVGSMRRYIVVLFDCPTNLRFVGLSLRLVHALATTANRKEKFQAAGAPEVITEVFKIGINKWDEGLIMWCNSATYRLCMGSPSNQEAFGIAGVCLCVSSALSKFSVMKSETVEAVLMSLVFLSRTCANSDITNENSQNSTAFFNLQCDRNVIRVLSEMAHLPDVMRVACNAVYVLARDAEAVHRMASHGVVVVLSDVLIRYCGQGSETIDVALAAMSVVELLLTYPPLIAMFSDKALLSYCLDLLEHHPSHFVGDCLEKVCSIIGQFAKWNEEYVSKMMDRNVCELVVDAYVAQTKVLPGTAVALSTVVISLSISDSIIQLFLKLSVTKLLIHVLNEFVDDDVTCSEACRALSVLSSHSDFRTAFLREHENEVRYAPVVTTLRRYISSKEIVESCLDMIINVYKLGGNDCDIHTSLLMEANLCELMPEILRKHSESSTIVSKCCMIMSMLCLQEKAADVLVSCGACEAVLKSLDLFLNEGGVAQYGCKFIRNLTVFPDYRDMLLSPHSTIEILLRVFDRHHKSKRILLESCAALVNLHSGRDVKPNPRGTSHSDVMQYFSVVAKVIAIHMESGALVAQISSLVKILADDSMNRGPLGVHGACGLLETALEKHESTPRVVEKILDAIARLAAGCADNCILFGKTNVFTHIISVWAAHKEDKAIVENSCKAIISLLSSKENSNIKYLREETLSVVVVDGLIMHAGDDVVCGMICQTISCVAKDATILTQLYAHGLTEIVAKLFRTFISQPTVRYISITLTILCSSADEVKKLRNCDMGGAFSQALTIHKSSELELTSVCVLISSFVKAADKVFAAALVDQYALMDTLNFIIEKHQQSTDMLVVVSEMLKSLTDKGVSLELTSPALVTQVVSSISDHKQDKTLVICFCNVLAGILCGKHFTNLAINGKICSLLCALVDMYRQDEQVVMSIARATEAFARIDISNAEKCAHSQLFANSLRLLKAHMNSEDTTVSLLKAIIAMNISHMNIKLFVNVDVLELLHYILTKHIESPSLSASSCDLLAQIVEDSSEVKQICTEAAFCGLVVRVLQLHVHEANATTAACGALIALCKEQKVNCRKIMELGVADIVAHALSFHKEVGTAFESLCDIITLLIESNSDFLLSVVALDIRPVLVQAVGHFPSVSIAASRSCVFLIRRLYELSPELVDVNISDECAHIISAMRIFGTGMCDEDSLSLLLDCCAVIYFLASTGVHEDGNAQVLGALGACQLVSECLAKSCAAANCIEISSLPIFTVISLIDNDRSGQNQVLFETETKVCRQLSFILKNLCENDAATDLEAAALNALAVLSRCSDTSSRGHLNVATFIEEDMCEVVLNHLERNVANSSLVYFTCEVMFNFTVCSEVASQRFLSCKAIAHLSKILQSYNDNIDLVIYALGSLSHLSSPNAAKNTTTMSVLEEFGLHGVLEMIVSSIELFHDNDSVVLFAVITVENLVRHKSMIHRLGRAGVCNVFSSAFLTHLSDPSIVFSILSTICVLVTDNVDNEEAFFRDGMETQLISLSSRHLTRDGDAVNVDLIELVFSMLTLRCDREGQVGIMLEVGILDLLSKAMACEALMRSLHVFVVSCALLVKVLDDVKEIDGAYLCEMIARNISAHKSNAEALDISCRALSRLKLFVTESDRFDDSLFNDASQHVLLSLQQDPTDSKESALQYCHAVHALVNLKESLIKNVDVYAKLTSIFTSFPADEDLLIETTKAVRALAKAGDSDGDPVACSDSGLTIALVKVLEGCSSGRQGLGKELCHTMSLLLSGNDVDMLMLFSRKELCVSLCYFLSTFLDDKACTVAACKVCVHLCKLPANRKTLGTTGLCDIILRVSQKHEMDENIMLLLLDFAFALVYECPENIESLATLEYCEHLTLVLSNAKFLDNVAMMLSGLRLVCLLASNRNTRSHLGRVGMCKFVVVVGQKHQGAEAIITSTMHAVRTMSSNCLENKNILGDVGCCEFLCCLLQEQQTNLEQCELICAAIASLLSSKNPDNPNVAKFKQSRLVTVIADVFQVCGNNTDIVKHLFVIVKYLALARIELAFTLRDHDILGKCIMLGQRYSTTPLSLSLCECIRALAQDKDNKYALGSCGACKVVTSVVRYAVDIVDVKLLEEALLTVASLVRGSCFNQGLLGSAGICKILAKLVEEGNCNGVSVAEKAFWCISLLARSDITSNTSNEGNIKVFSDYGVMNSILVTYHLHENQDQLVKATSWALRNMCFVPANAQLFMRQGGYSFLLRALQCYFHDIGVCEAICYALPPLLDLEGVETGQELEERILETCELLVPVLSSHIGVETIVNRISSSFSIICVKSVRARQFLGAKGACSLMTRAFKIHMRSNSAVVEEMCGAMWNLCMDNSDNKARLGNEGACEMVMDALRHHSANKYVVEAATGCLLALSEDQPENTLRLENYKRRVADEAKINSGIAASSGQQGRTSTAKVTSPAPIVNSE